MRKIPKSAWYLLLKVALMLLSFYFILLHVKQEDVQQHLLMLKKNYLANSDARIYILAATALMLMNWFCESLKWKYLTSFFYRQSIVVAARAVLTGLAVSIFTPNRSGDFAGRIMHLPPAFRLEGAIFSVIGSITQILITITAGCVAMLYLWKDLFVFSVGTIVTSFFFVFLVILILHYVLFNLKRYWQFLAEAKWLKKLTAKINDVGKMSPSFLLKIYGLSLLRYVIFSLQFYILLKAFDVQLSFSIIISLIMISFLFITAIPTFAISEVGIRGSICIFFFSKFTQETSGVLLASTALWVINIALPAVFGAFGMLYFKRIK